MRVVWTRPALRDLAAARARIAFNRPDAADRQMDRIAAAVAGGGRFPETARPGRRPGTRELVVGGTPFLVPYRIRGDVVEVLRVLHSSRRWPEAM